MAKSMKSKPVRIPPFRPLDVPLWFEEVEREFLSKGITSDSNKFGYVVTYLYPICLPLFQNIMINPPIIGKFEKVKNNLIMYYRLLNDEYVLRQIYRRYHKTIRENEDYISQNVPSHKSGRSRSCFLNDE